MLTCDLSGGTFPRFTRQNTMLGEPPKGTPSFGNPPSISSFFFSMAALTRSCAVLSCLNVKLVDCVLQSVGCILLVLKGGWGDGSFY